MSQSGRYPVPAQTCRVEEEIRRSRFITTVGHTPSVGDARCFVQGLREEFPDASHNCWAYLVGPPGTSVNVGMSDDGEPHGTAGRPMLTVLAHSGVGDISAVVTRYFGGTKLGTGGLVRAYAGGVQRALQELRLADRMVLRTLRVVVGYGCLSPLRRMLPDFEVRVEEETFGAEVACRLALPEERVEAFEAALRGLTNGKAAIERV